MDLTKNLGLKIQKLAIIIVGLLLGLGYRTISKIWLVYVKLNLGSTDTPKNSECQCRTRVGHGHASDTPRTRVRHARAVSHVLFGPDTNLDTAGHGFGHGQNRSTIPLLCLNKKD